MKKFVFYNISLIVLIYLSSVSFFAGSIIDEVKQKIKDYNNDYPAEKIYIQLDKPLYKPGDIVWFNLIALDATSHMPATKSDVIYAELIDPKGSVVKKLELPIEKGTARGDIDLPKDIGGLYTLKAYTNWSRNFDEAYLLERQIPVQNVITTRLLLKPDFNKASYSRGESGELTVEIRNLQDEPAALAKVRYALTFEGKQKEADTLNADEKGKVVIPFMIPKDLEKSDGLLNVIVKYEGIEESLARSIPIINNDISLNFYPEGGNMIEGEIMKIAFEAKDEYGDPSDIVADILDEQGKEIITIESFHDGMGMFRLKPEPNKRYYAKLLNPSGNDSLYQLPSAFNTTGLTLREKTAKNLEFEIVGKSDAHFLIAHSKGEVVLDRDLKFKKRFSLPTKDLPAGIIVFSLFNSHGLPVSERLVFLNPEKTMQISVTTDKKTYKPGENVKMKIQTSSPDGTPLQGKLGLSVVDDQLISLADNQEDHILSYFLLSSELKGKIENPSFYFDPDEKKAEKALDLLMMVRGWRRFTWNEVLKGLEKEIAYPPERVRVIAGRLLTEEGKPASGIVYALESGGDKRMIKLKTSTDGHFVFRNFNPTVSLYILTEKPNKVFIDDERVIEPLPSRSTKWNEYIYDFYEQEFYFENNLKQTEEPESVLPTDTDFSLLEDELSLDEVVVTGYGVQRKSDLTGSVVRIRGINDISHYSDMSALQGALAGIVVTNPATDPGTPLTISFSKAKSLASGNNSPLLVLNGFVIPSSISRLFLNSEMFSPERIESLTYTDAPEARHSYGSKAAHGVMIIRTKDMITPGSYQYKSREGDYTGVILVPRTFSLVREMYKIQEEKKENTKEEIRKNFDHLIYWNPEIITDDKGIAEIDFLTNDAISTFRITAEGISNTGLVGRKEQTYHTIIPMSLDAKLPGILGFEDTAQVQLSISNKTDTDISGSLEIQASGLSLDYQKTVNVKAGTNKYIPVMITTLARKGRHQLRIILNAGNHMDMLEKEIFVYPAGFPASLNFSGQNPNTDINFTVSNPEDGSLEAALRIYPDIMSQLESAAEKLFREPHGCFEQVSSTLYPAILALQYLNSTGGGTEESRKRAITSIRSGYQKLAAFEVRGGGFEWFGHSPAHEGLTAFGLMEFLEMEKVYRNVDQEMIRRTIDWLMSRRDGEGGFKKKKGKYGFSTASHEVNNAYIVYALSEAGVKDMEKEYSHSLKEALESKDLYRMALMALAAHNLEDHGAYKNLTSYFKEHVRINGYDNISADHSLVRSYGDNLATEIVSLWTLALLKEKTAELQRVSENIKFILSKRKSGYFGSTQSTALSLQALTAYNLLKSEQPEPSTLEVIVNGRKSDSLHYSGKQNSVIILDNFTRYLKTDSMNHIKLHYPGKEVKIPYSLTVNWLDKLPPTSDDAAIHIKTFLSDSEIRVNETVRLNLQVKNTRDKGLPMSIVRVGIPGGLSLQTWQLIEYQEKGIFDFYEIINGDLVIYYREMGPRQQMNIFLDLKAEVPGTYQGRAGTGYLYYNDENRYWTEGVKIKINQ